MGGNLDTDKLENEIEKTLAANDLDGQATCPDDVKGQAGGTFECTVRAGDDSRQVVVTQKDDEGNVHWEFETLSTAAY